MKDSPQILGPVLAPSCAGLIFVFTSGTGTQADISLKPREQRN
jgi:hypothetical protein